MYYGFQSWSNFSRLYHNFFKIYENTDEIPQRLMDSFNFESLKRVTLLKTLLHLGFVCVFQIRYVVITLERLVLFIKQYHLHTYSFWKLQHNLCREFAKSKVSSMECKVWFLGQKRFDYCLLSKWRQFCLVFCSNRFFSSNLQRFVTLLCHVL